MARSRPTVTVSCGLVRARACSAVTELLPSACAWVTNIKVVWLPKSESVIAEMLRACFAFTVLPCLAFQVFPMSSEWVNPSPPHVMKPSYSHRKRPFRWCVWGLRWWVQLSSRTPPPPGRCGLCSLCPPPCRNTSAVNHHSNNTYCGKGQSHTT